MNHSKCSSADETLSMFFYYLFETCKDTCFTSQITDRASLMLSSIFANLFIGSELVLGCGSSGEGTYLSSDFQDCSAKGNISDRDILFVQTEFQVYPMGFNGEYDLNKYCLQITQSKHTRPGYCLVEVVGQKEIDLELYFITRCRQSMEHTDTFERIEALPNAKPMVSVNGILNGPSLASELFLIPSTSKGIYRYIQDSVISFGSIFWPTECRQWPEIIPTGWPSLELQTQTKEIGFHIVKIGHPLSIEKDSEWRLSFSLAEKVLVSTFNPTQLKCAVIMKALVYRFIKPHFPNTINSYHIKTIMLWSVEKDSHQKWEPEYLLQCLNNLLGNLIKYLNMINLPHYFVPDNNLFQCKVTENNTIQLSNQVKLIQSTLAEKCRILLGYKKEFVRDQFPQAGRFQLYSIVRIAFRELLSTKAFFSERVKFYMDLLFHEIAKDCVIIAGISNRLLNILYTFLNHLQCSIVNTLSETDNDVHRKVIHKYHAGFKTWLGSIFLALSKIKIIREHPISAMKLPHYNLNSEITYAAKIGEELLVKSFEDASTTGCIKMALSEISNGQYYHAVPLLNRALNIIDKFESFGNFDLENYEHSYLNDFTKMMHLYNDEVAIGNELAQEWLGDKILIHVQFIWWELNLLPIILQLELTLNIQNFSKHQTGKFRHLFQDWNPIPLTLLLLFICHFNLVKLKLQPHQTYLMKDIEYLEQDIDNLWSLGSDTEKLTEDDQAFVYNLISWCLLQMATAEWLHIRDRHHMTLRMIKCLIKAVQISNECKNTLFSHLFIQHVLRNVSITIKPSKLNSETKCWL